MHHNTLSTCVYMFMLQVGALYGAQQGQQRGSILSKFNQGQLHVLLTSDAFGLGLDYQGVDVVVCLDEVAPTAQAYVARWVALCVCLCAIFGGGC